MRTVIFMLYLWIEQVFFLIPFARARWLEKHSTKEKHDAFVQNLVRNWARRLLWLAGAKVDVKGVENIPTDVPCVFAVNHQSFFDILVVLGYFDKPHALLSKASIGKVPLIRLWMRELRCVFVDREDMKAGIEAVKKMTEIVEGGDSAIIFPEGTRSKTGEIAEFKGGAFKVAQKSGAPVVPVALDGTRDIFENNKYRVKSSSVKLRILPPVQTAEMSRADFKEFPEKIRQLVVDAKAGE